MGDEAAWVPTRACVLRWVGRTMVAQWSMKMAASAFCSRMPSVIPMAMAMSEALTEYSAQRQ